jgi:hypothetical protein
VRFRGRDHINVFLRGIRNFRFTYLPLWAKFLRFELGGIRSLRVTFYSSTTICISFHTTIVIQEIVIASIGVGKKRCRFRHGQKDKKLVFDEGFEKDDVVIKLVLLLASELRTVTNRLNESALNNWLRRRIVGERMVIGVIDPVYRGRSFDFAIISQDSEKIRQDSRHELSGMNAPRGPWIRQLSSRKCSGRGGRKRKLCTLQFPISGTEVKVERVIHILTCLSPWCPLSQALTSLPTSRGRRCLSEMLAITRLKWRKRLRASIPKILPPDS